MVVIVEILAFYCGLLSVLGFRRYVLLMCFNVLLGLLVGLLCWFLLCLLTFSFEVGFEFAFVIVCTYVLCLLFV